MTALPPTATIREVGPRDGFQSIASFIPTDRKISVIEALAAAGLSRIEVTSFSRGDRIPQLADATDVLERSLIPDGVSISVLIPNEKGLDRALASRDRFQEVSCVVSASESHNHANLNVSIEGSLGSCEQSIARSVREGLRVEGVISVAFGCPYEGKVPVRKVLEIAGRLAEAGCSEIAFGDTTGMANPIQVREFFAEASLQLPGVELTGHFHNTRGQGIANLYAAIEGGCAGHVARSGVTGA